MMEIVRYRYFIYMLHTLAWAIVLFFPFLISSAASQYSIGPLPGFYFTLSGIVHIIIFYVNAFFLYPKLLNRSYWWLYIACIVLLILLSVQVKYIILAEWFSDAPADARTHVLFPSLMVFIVSVFYSITIEKIRTEKLQKENEALQLGAELKFLRSQISPHFLFNILTSLVSLARKKSDQLETSLLMLSGLMRYMLYDPAKKISLQQEVEYLDNYIALQKLRFGREVEIVFDKELSAGATNYNIEPMLLISFVENAFKHGTGFVHISLKTGQGVVKFDVMNKFEEEISASKDENSGIGLSNVRSRLALLYAGRYELVIHDDENVFSIHLTLQLL
jgi:two-component system, LytTR family, sensor kinase